MSGLDFLLIAPARDLDDLTRVVDECIVASRPLDADEDDALTSSRRAETLHQLGVITIRRRGRR